MTLQAFVAYEEVLRDNDFTANNPKAHPPTDFSRECTLPDEVSRVHLYQDGTFRAYNSGNQPMCHGEGAWQLQGCV